jgi:predicted SAM-dependent methyltransferase
MKKVHLCCGPEIWGNGWTNVDAIDFGGNIVADLGKPWTFAEDHSVDEIVCNDGFEHMIDVEHFLEQCARVLKPGGTVRLWVPHYKSPSAYRITHKTLYSWSLWNAYPEPHDRTKTLRVKSNRLFIGRRDSTIAKPFHAIINLFPKWWERLAYVSNVEVVLERVPH